MPGQQVKTGAGMQSVTGLGGQNSGNREPNVGLCTPGAGRGDLGHCEHLDRDIL